MIEIGPAKKERLDPVDSGQPACVDASMGDGGCALSAASEGDGAADGDAPDVPPGLPVAGDDGAVAPLANPMPVTEHAPDVTPTAREPTPDRTEVPESTGTAAGEPAATSTEGATDKSEESAPSGDPGAGSRTVLQPPAARSTSSAPPMPPTPRDAGGPPTPPTPPSDRPDAPRGLVTPPDRRNSDAASPPGPPASRADTTP